MTAFLEPQVVPSTIVKLTSQILLEFEKQKWEEDYLGWASVAERKANSLAHKTVRFLRLGDIESVAKTTGEMSVINDVRWTKFTRNISKLIKELGHDS